MRGTDARSMNATAAFLTLCLALLVPSPVAASPDPVDPPNDPLWSEQWALGSAPGVGIGVLQAWSMSKGSGVVVGVVDSGIVVHPEFDGRVLPGYDFISNPSIAGDGDGRDADPSDPGDWVGSDEIANGTLDPSCEVEDSVWHGTHVAGIIAASANNAIGVAGIAPEALILPVRVVGKCGGRESDLIDGLRWAAGLPVDGVPLNLNPATVINVSLGSVRPCSPQLQAVVDEISALGSIIVSSVGNDNHDASLNSPANCLGTLTVAALNQDGLRAFYSNYGLAVDLSAPGGDRAAGIQSTVDLGVTVPTGPGYASLIGTSMAAPMVTGVLALARALDPSTSRVDLLDLLLEHLAPFNADPSPSGCSTESICGAGALDAARFLDALESRASPAVTSSVATGMRVGTQQTVQIIVDGLSVDPILVASGACELEQRIVRAVGPGSCVLTYQRPGTMTTRNINLRFSIRILKTSAPRVALSLPASVRVGERQQLTVATVATGTKRFTSLTPTRCRISGTGQIRGIRSGACTVRVRIAPANGFVARTSTITFKISP